MMRGESDGKPAGDQPENSKPVRRMEIGNDRSIALSELVRLYTGNSQFLSDVTEIDDNMQPYRSSIDWDAVHEGHSILGDALKHPEYQNLFVRVTEAWKRNWEDLRSVLPDSTRSEVEGLTSKWGASFGLGLWAGNEPESVNSS